MAEIQWMSAAPLWPQTAANGTAASRPVLLRFVNDDFMSELATVVDNQPERLADYEARHETWRKPLSSPDQVPALPPALRALARRRGNRQATTTRIKETTPDENPLKLFQPAHQRYYLATASLVCRQPGLPDRSIDSGKGERAGFVIRRLLPKPDQAAALGTTGAAGSDETATPRWSCPSHQADGAPPFLAAAQQASKGISTPDGECDEYAFVQGSDGAAWQIVPDGSKTVSGEERLPLFPVNYTQADDYRRRILAGLVPVGRREAYLGTPEAGAAGSSSQGAMPDSRLDALLNSTFTRPWQNLVDTAANTLAKLNYDHTHPVEEDPRDAGEKAADIQVVIRTTRLQLQETSWYLLADLFQFLDDIQSSDSQAILSILATVRLPSTTRTAIQAAFGMAPVEDLGKAFVEIQKSGQIDLLERATAAYDGTGWGSKWPNFLFPLVDVAYESGHFYLTVAGASSSPATASDLNGFQALAEQCKDWIRDQLGTDHFHTPLLSALPTPDTDARLAPVPLAAQTPARIGDNGWFVIRCVFERPNCLPAPVVLLSEPTQPFQMAGFFDPDAPARPIRINLPIDTTPAGLRKFDKNTAFMISDVLCGQIQRAKGLGLVDLVMSVLPWPLHKDLDVPDSGPCGSPSATFGMICSLSIPIITICALILLMIIVSLLDIIFRWMPYFIFCFPLPKFGGKKGTS